MKIGELKQLISDHDLDDDVEIIFQSTQYDFTIEDLRNQMFCSDEDYEILPLNSQIFMQDIYVQQDIKTSKKDLLIVCDVKIEEVK